MKIDNKTRPTKRYAILDRSLEDTVLMLSLARTVTAFASEALRQNKSPSLSSYRVAELTRVDSTDGSKGVYEITSWLN